MRKWWHELSWTSRNSRDGTVPRGLSVSQWDLSCALISPAPKSLWQWQQSWICAVMWSSKRCKTIWLWKKPHTSYYASQNWDKASHKDTSFSSLPLENISFMNCSQLLSSNDGLLKNIDVWSQTELFMNFSLLLVISHVDVYLTHKTNWYRPLSQMTKEQTKNNVIPVGIFGTYLHTWNGWDS